MYLNRDEYEAVCAAALEAGLADPQRRSLLLAWIPGDVVGALDRQSAPANQLKSDLEKLNGLESAEALITWLKNAAGLVSYLPSKKALFEQTAQRLAKSPKAVTPSTPPPAGPQRIQFFSASPTTLDSLQYGRELRLIRERLLRHNGRLEVGTIHPGATLRRFQEWLRDDTPSIIHLSCHGDEGRLALERDDGRAHLIDIEVMIRMLNTVGRVRQARGQAPARLLVINACKSHLLAERAVNEVEGLDFAIGTRDVIKDESAIAFADEFYSALDTPLQFAFDAATTRVLGEKFPKDADLFSVHVRDGVDPMTVLIPQ